MQTKIDHIGIAVRDLNEAIALYGGVFGLPMPRVDEWEEVADQGVRVAMLDAGESRLELLEATKPDSAIAKFIEKRGPGMHHVAFRVPDIREALRRAEQAGLTLIDHKPRRGAGGHFVAFLHPHSTEGVLIELCQEEG